MSFGLPIAAVAGLVVALAFVALAAWSVRRARGAALAYSDLAFLERAAGARIPWTAVFVGGWAAALIAGGFAFARPSIVANVAVHDASIVLCIDTSGSMIAGDVAPTRSQASRDAAATFIDSVPDGTRVGLVAFSTAAIPLGPLTDDREAAREELARLPAPNGGTAIGDALTTAARMLPPAGRRAIVLVTDGVNNAGTDPGEAAQAIGAQGILIFTVGIGTNGSGIIIPGTADAAELDEDALREIAAAGKGTYARVADAGALRDRLGALAKATIDERRRVDLTARFGIAAGALAFVTVLGALATGRFP